MQEAWGSIPSQEMDPTFCKEDKRSCVQQLRYNTAK